MVRIHFSLELPENRTKVYAHYMHKSIKHGGWRELPVKEHLYLKQKDYFHDLELWHQELCAKAVAFTDYWWLFSASRLIVWFPPIFKPFFFAVAVKELIQEQDLDELTLLGCPREVADYLKEMLPSCQLELHNKLSGASCFSDNGLQKPKRFKPLRFLVKAGIAGFCMLFRKRKRKSVGKNCLLVFSNILNEVIFEQRGDHFFGDNFETHTGLNNEEVHWLYLSDSHRQETEAARILESSRRRFSFVDDWLTGRDLFSLLRIAGKLVQFVHCMKDRIPDVRVGLVSSPLMAQEFYLKTLAGDIPLVELKIFLAFRKLVKYGSVSRVLYPYEEKGLERAILKACRESGQAIMTTGFAHAFYNEGQLYLKWFGGNGYNPPRPDEIATTGSAVNLWLNRWAHVPQESMRTFGSPRCVVMQEKPPSVSAEGLLRVLIIISQGYEALVLANSLEGYPGIFDHCEVVIRPYPYAWQSAQNEAYRRIRSLAPQIRIEGEPLFDQIERCNCAVYCSSSAGLEVMLRGRLAIYLDLNHIFRLNPVEGKGCNHEVVFGCENAEELQNVFTRILRMDESAYKTAAQAQQDFALRIYEPLRQGLFIRLDEMKRSNTVD